MAVPAESMQTMTDEDMQAERAARQSYLNDIGAKLEAQKNEAIQWRRTFETRWVEAEIQYQEGRTPLTEAKDGNLSKAETHRQTPDNITRTKVRTIAARLQDMLFPSSDRNWDIDPSPIPDIPGLTPEQTANIQDIAKARAKRMDRRITDDLAECRYAEHGRSALFDGCKLGSGVIKGPFPRATTSKRAMTRVLETVFGQTQATELVSETKIRPAATRVDLWNFYPQPSRNMEECGHTFELHLLTAKALRDLAKQPGFDPEQINQLLEQKPDAGRLNDRPVVSRATSRTDMAAIMKDRYPIWEYRGPVPRECLEHFGVKLREGDNLTVFNGEIWFSQGVVIKSSVSPLEDGDSQSYYVWCYEEDPDSIFGFGVPHVCASDQHGANITWSATVLNAIMSAAPQGGVLKGALRSQDGSQPDLTYDRPRMWVLDSVDDIDKAISWSVVPNTTGDTMAVYERCKANADEHTMLPLIAQGEPSAAVPTSSGLALLMNASNIVQRQAAKAWDDRITVPMLRQFVEFEMLHGDDEEAKGDFNVVPKGASHLLVKDVQLQHTVTMLQMADNPANAPHFDRRFLLDNLVGFLDLPAEKAMLPMEKVEQMLAQQAQQPDPEMAKAELMAQIRREEIAAENERVRMRVEGDLLVTEMNQQTAAMKLASDEKITLQDVAAKLALIETAERVKTLRTEIDSQRKAAIEAERERTKRINAGMQAELKAQDQADKRRSQQVQIAAERPLRLNG